MESNGAFLRYKNTFLKNKRAFLESKRVILDYKRAILEDERTILGIKGHFGEVKEHNYLRTRILATSPHLCSLKRSFFDVSSQGDILKSFSRGTFSHGSDIKPLNSPNYSLTVLQVVSHSGNKFISRYSSVFMIRCNCLYTVSVQFIWSRSFPVFHSS